MLKQETSSLSSTALTIKPTGSARYQKRQLLPRRIAALSQIARQKPVSPATQATSHFPLSTSHQPRGGRRNVSRASDARDLCKQSDVALASHSVNRHVRKQVLISPNGVGFVTYELHMRPSGGKIRCCFCQVFLKHQDVLLLQRRLRRL